MFYNIFLISLYMSFGEIARNIETINFNLILEKIFRKDKVINYVVEAIQERLYSHGVTGDGEVLITDKAIAQGNDAYSNYTEFLKHEKGQPINRVTLSDTQEFEHSIVLNAKKTYFEIKADFDKDGENIYLNFQDSFANQQDFEDSVLKLTYQEYEILIKKYVFTEIIKEIKRIV